MEIQFGQILPKAWEIWKYVTDIPPIFDKSYLFN